MRRVTIVTANGLFKKGKETNTTKRQIQEELRIAEGICQDTARRGQVRAVSFYQSCAKKIHPALPIAERSGRCCCEMCKAQLMLLVISMLRNSRGLFRAPTVSAI